MHSREISSALLWPDYQQSKAFTNLRHTLWEIQQTVGEDWLDTSRDKIGLYPQADIWLDVDHFKSLLNRVIPKMISRFVSPFWLILRNYIATTF